MRETVEDVVGATAKFIFKVIIWDFALFQVGRAVMLAVTLGRYPTRKDCAQSHGRIQWVGIATLVVAWLVIATINNLGH